MKRSVAVRLVVVTVASFCAGFVVGRAPQPRTATPVLGGDPDLIELIGAVDGRAVAVPVRVLSVQRDGGDAVPLAESSEASRPVWTVRVSVKGRRVTYRAEQLVAGLD